MNKRPVLIAAVSMFGGTLFILYDRWIFCLIPILITPIIFYRRSVRRAIMLLAVSGACFIAGIMVCNARVAAYDRACLNIWNHSSVTLYGRITRKDRTAYGTRHYISLRGTPGIRVTFTCDHDAAGTGALIRVTGTPEVPEALRNPGCFDQLSYYRALSIVSDLKDVRCDVISGQNGIMELLYLLRYAICSVLMAALPGEEGSLLASLCIGTRSLLDSDVKALLSDAGLSHILAVSGLHISILGGAFFRALKGIHIPVKAASVISFIAVFFYAHSISDSVSARRAVIMYMIFMISRLLTDRSDTLTSLSIALIYVCITDPLAVTGAAFVMSFAAVLLISLVAIPAGNCYRTFCDLRWENHHKKVHGARHRTSAFEDLVSSLLFSLCIQLSMGAISARYFYTFPLFSCILNTVVLPFLPFLIVMGIAGGIIGIFCLPVAKLLLLPCHLILYWYELSSDAYTKIPLSTLVTGHMGTLRLSLCLLSVLIISILLKKQSRRLFDLRYTKLPWTKLAVFPLFGSRHVTAVTAALSCLIVIIMALPHHENSFQMIDCGQGDSLMLTTADGRCFMFDGGSTTESSPGRNILLPSLWYRGISQVDGWFLTHLDDDHINGFTELVNDGYPVDTLYLSAHIPHDDKFSMITSLCSSHNIRIRYLDGRSSLRCPFFSIQTIYPDRNSDFEGANENSLVTLIDLCWSDNSCTRIIETGDISDEQERYILDRYSGTIKKGSHDTLILKSAHHGSNHSNCSEWLEALSPDLILISAGAGNRYGHPGKDTLSRIHDAGLEYLCTIDTGQIQIHSGGHYFTTRS